MRRLSAFLLIIPLLAASALPAASQSPTDELLTGMVTEEVEPGVFRVVSDGERDLESADIQGIAAGHDGHTWLLLEDEFAKLGGEEAHDWPTALGPKGYDLEVGPDGTFWVIPDDLPDWTDWSADVWAEDVYRSADGEEWSIMPCPADCKGVTIAPDGRVWASWRSDTWLVGQLGPEGWEPLEGLFPDGFGPGGFYRLTFTDSGDIYGVGDGWGDTLFRYEGGTWHNVAGAWLMPIRVGTDGTAWGIEGDRWHRGLARHVDGEWSHWSHDELPEMSWTADGDEGLGIGFDLGDGFRVAPDGSLWARLWRGGPDVESLDPNASMEDSEQRFRAVTEGRAACDGVVRFDGLTTDHFLPGRCVRWDFAYDGSIWVLAAADEAGGPDLYVITPEAVQ